MGRPLPYSAITVALLSHLFQRLFYVCHEIFWLLYAYGETDKSVCYALLLSRSSGDLGAHVRSAREKGRCSPYPAKLMEDLINCSAF